MDELLRQLLENSSGLVAYGMVFAVLVACGLGVPLPEDISLILGGFLAHEGAAKLPLMMLVGFLGILVGDSLIYAAGRRIGPAVGKRPGGIMGRIVTPEKRARVQGLFAKHGEKIVMIARFLPGVRAVTYFTAGSARMPFSRFLFFDGVAAIASAPLFVYLGYRFGGELEMLLSAVKRGQTKVIVGLLAVVVAYGVYVLIRRKLLAARAAAEAPKLSAAPTLTPREDPPLPYPTEPPAPLTAVKQPR